MSDPLAFDAEFLRRLEVLNVVARRVLQGSLKADRRSARRGVSAEFIDHRPYVVGDDLRHLDWHLFGRLEELFLKLYREEENLHLTLLVDVSGSMAHRPSEGPGLAKRTYALQVAAALAYLGLSNMDRVNLVPFASNLEDARWRIKGRAQAYSLFSSIRELDQLPGGATDLRAVIKAFVARERRRGVVVVLSDFFDLEGYGPALKMLRMRKHEVFAIHVVDPSEREPRVRGDLRLVDSETGAGLEVNVTDELRGRYREAFGELLRGVERFCVRNEFGYVEAGTEVPFDALVLTILRRGGLVA
ncbi:MAG: DUF58 domain-containing protein [Planctomycetes bacterium]|nr:DUF58 domain-containing protein [Planctomycetota bacterium]